MMRFLVKKNFLSLHSWESLIFLLAAASICWSVYDGTTSLLNFGYFIAFMWMMTVFDREQRVGFDSYSRTLPLSGKLIVLAKYGWCFTVLFLLGVLQIPAWLLAPQPLDWQLPVVYLLLAVLLAAFTLTLNTLIRRFHAANPFVIVLMLLNPWNSVYGDTPIPPSLAFLAAHIGWLFSGTCICVGLSYIFAVWLWEKRGGQRNVRLAKKRTTATGDR